MTPKVHVLLATYNGEKYLTELMDSLFGQTYSNYTVYAIDDGSTDSTLKILQRYTNKGLIIIPNQENLGYPYSFFKLVNECGGADYYCFCDQDDVWLPNKISMAVEKLNEKSSKSANIYFSDFYYCDKELNIVKTSVPAPSYIGFRNAFFQCYLWGFTAVFNEATRILLKDNNPKKFKSKDYWTHLLCSAFGEIVYDPRVSAKYRRHGENVSADSLSFFKFQWWRIKHFLLNNTFQDYHEMLVEFYEIYSDKLTAEQKKELFLFQSRGHVLRKVFYPKRLRSKLFDEIMLRLVFLSRKL